jgi:hypothetical protein
MSTEFDDRRLRFRTLYRHNAALRKGAEVFGLSAEEMGLALHYAALAKAMKQAGIKNPAYPPVVETGWEKKPHAMSAKLFCDQCDKLVYRHEAQSCQRAFCKAKPQVEAEAA